MGTPSTHESSAPTRAGDRPPRWVAPARLRLGLAIVLTVAAIACHVVFLIHAGGLWRDEANTVAMATMPNLAEVWALISRDNMGLLPLMAVRGWCALGLGEGDTGLRVLGGVVGIGLVATYWIASLSMRREAPVLALALAGLNVEMVRSVDALRAYGLGALLAVLAFAAMWHLARKPTLRRAAVAAWCGSPVRTSSLWQRLPPARSGRGRHVAVRAPTRLARGRLDRGGRILGRMLAPPLRPGCPRGAIVV